MRCEGICTFARKVVQRCLVNYSVPIMMGLFTMWFLMVMDVRQAVPLLGFSLFILCACMCVSMCTCVCTRVCTYPWRSEDNLACHLSDVAMLAFGDRVFLTVLELIK